MELDLTNDTATSEDIPESVLDSAAEMVVYLNFMPLNTTIFLLKLIQTEDIQVKQVMNGIKDLF